mmetsp:Transcript_6513/g.18748  ORF Transcript_6513/g.18748 Transcript_6513/m.18748 type:complete len:336 (-) Transcript_6513:672-1679(-)
MRTRHRGLVRDHGRFGFEVGLRFHGRSHRCRRHTRRRICAVGSWAQFGLLSRRRPLHEALLSLIAQRLLLIGGVVGTLHDTLPISGPPPAPHIRILLWQIANFVFWRDSRKLHRRRGRQGPQVGQDGVPHGQQLLLAVGVLHVAHGDAQLVGVHVVVELRQCLLRQVVVEVVAQHAAGLVAPTPCHVAHGVPPAPQQQKRHIEAGHVLDALRVPLQAQIEAPQPVAAEAVGAAAHDHCLWLVHLHHLGHDRLEDELVGGIVHALLQRHVHAVLGAAARPCVIQCAGAREEVAILVERHGHDAVSGVERLLHPVTVVDVDVHIQHPAIGFEELQNG